MLILDCLGEMCPLPVLKVRELLSEVSHGETLKVITDHSCVLSSLSGECREKYQLEINEPQSGIWEIFIEAKPQL